MTMDFEREILLHLLARYDVSVRFENLDDSIRDLAHLECMLALHEIRAILDDETLEEDVYKRQALGGALYLILDLPV